MPTRLFVLAVTLVAFLALGGVAYACGPGCGVGLWGNGQCQAQIGWENAKDFPANPTVICSVAPYSSSSPAETLTVLVSHLAPGENCKITASIVNLDSKTATLKESKVLTEYAACHFQYTDNFPSSLSLGAGKSFAYSSTFALLASGTTSACEGHSGEVSVVIGP